MVLNMFWNPPISRSFYHQNSPISIVIYNGFVTKRSDYKKNNVCTTYSLVDADSKRLFLIENLNDVKICSIQTVKTQSYSVFLIEQRSQFVPRSATNISKKNLDEDIFYGMKISMVHMDIGTQLEEMYKAIRYEKCLSDMNMYDHALILSKLSRALVVPFRNGLFGQFTGEVLRIFSCKPYAFDIRLSKNCYEEFPVSFKFQDYYIQIYIRVFV